MISGGGFLKNCGSALMAHLTEFDRHDSRAIVVLLGELLDFINAPFAPVGPLVDLAVIPTRGERA